MIGRARSNAMFSRLGAGAVVFALALVPAPGAKAQDVIKIGIPTGLSGANSVVAPSVVQSAELAVDEINAAGGILGRPIVRREEDDEGSPAKEPALIKKYQLRTVRDITSCSTCHR